MKIKKTIKYLMLATILTITSGTMIACQSQADNSGAKSKQAEPSKNNEDKSDVDTSSITDTSDEKNKDKKKDSSNKKRVVKVSNKDKKEAKPMTTDLKEITYYTYDINTEKLTAHTKMVNEISVGNIMKELSANGVIPKNASVNTAKVVTVDGIRTLNVDVNDAFVNFNQGSSAETLSLQAFANSMVKTFKVKQVKLTVDGKNYSSGHIALKDNEYLKFK